MLASSLSRLLSCKTLMLLLLTGVCRHTGILVTLGAPHADAHSVMDSQIIMLVCCEELVAGSQ